MPFEIQDPVSTDGTQVLSQLRAGGNLLPRKVHFQLRPFLQLYLEWNVGCLDHKVTTDAQMFLKHF